VTRCQLVPADAQPMTTVVITTTELRSICSLSANSTTAHQSTPPLNHTAFSLP